MTFTTTIRVSVAALVAAAAAAPVGLAQQGEPKNEWPFTRPVDDRGTAQVHESVGATYSDVRGEPKNEPPFTRLVQAPPVVIRASSDFDWGDAGIGAGAALGIATAAFGAVVLIAPHSRRPRPTGA